MRCVTCGLTTLALVVGLAASLYPKLAFLGVFRDRTDIPLNNEHCVAIEGIQAAEDAWIDQHSGIAYIAASSFDARHKWMPGGMPLNATSLPEISTDYIEMLDLNTNSHSRMKIVGAPNSFPGIYVHGISGWSDPTDPTRLTIFAISHRPPVNRSTAARSGADSVVEIFETVSDTDTLHWIKTVRHEGIRTPNGLAPISHRKFYVTNDHKSKTSWMRHLEVFYPEPSDIAYCDASGETPDCHVAVNGLTFPNGIAKGPGSLIYSVSSLDGKLSIFEAQADYSLNLRDIVKIPRPADNLHVRPTGEIIVAAFPEALDLVKSTLPDAQVKGVTAATEAFQVSNETSETQSKGTYYKVTKIFGDGGSKVSSSTCAAPYKNKMLFTGGYAERVVICTLPSDV